MGLDRPTNELPSPRVHTDGRRQDIELKQDLIAQLMDDKGCEGALVLHPANVRWLTSGATPVGLIGRDEFPGLYFTATQRWLLSSATDTQRLFTEELDGLGFMLKEWHWTTSREQMLADLTHGRTVVSDQSFRDCKVAAAFFIAERRKISAYESDRYVELGKLVAHAIEATARNFGWGDTEEEIAGHLAHRLIRHGLEPIALQVTGDGRGRDYRRRGFQPDTVDRWCVLQATGRAFGLHATACRTVSRGPIADAERAEFEAGLRLRAAHLIHARPGERVWAAMEAGKSLLRPSAYEHEWLAAPAAVLTGREPSEGVVLPGTQDLWTTGWAAVWQERIGATAVVDTCLLQADGWRLLTPCDDWPIRRAVTPNQSFDFADVLVRKD